jgi:hypothetical protein
MNITTKSNKYFPLILGCGVIVVVLAIVYFVALKPTNPTTNPVSVRLPVSMGVVAAASLDSQGNPVRPTTVFSSSDKTIYLVVNLKNAKKNDIVSYARYYKGKYINAQTTRIVDTKANRVIFAFNKDKGYPVGKYDYKFFYNKKLLNTYSYTIN